MSSCNLCSTSPIPDLPVEISTANPVSIDQDSTPLAASTVNRPFPPIHLKSLRAGCYYLSYIPTGIVLLTRFYGTMRVEKPTPSSTTASGDLYSYPLIAIPGNPIPNPPTPSSDVPIFPLSRYNSYLRVTSIPEGITAGNSFTLAFERHTFNASTGTWAAPVSLTAVMTWTAAPAGYVSDFLTGQVKNASGSVIATLNMGWVSSYLRRVVVEIDTVPGSEAPLNNGSGIDWQAIGNEISWKIDAYTSSATVSPPSGDSWSDGEMHAGMLAKRDSSDLNSTWRYHILAVKLIDSTPRGIMYDVAGTDSDHVPREGIGIASHWMIPNTSDWGLVKGQRFGAAIKPYFRTALHEIGHAMSLYHNTVNNGVMNTTDVIAASGTAANPFPNNIIWAHAANDQKRLRHRPDIHVRPGGTSFGAASDTPMSPDDVGVEPTGLTLEVRPVLETVPLGAPVRVDVSLKNTGDRPVSVPAELSLKTEFISGHVMGPTSERRTFAPVMFCVEDHAMIDLAPGSSVHGSLTLLRGKEGALFPVASIHTINVDVHWEVAGAEVTVTGSTTVMITPTTALSHAEAAHKVLATPDAHLVLVFGGDHLKEGVAAVHAALADPTLRPHFAYTEARRVGTRFMHRPANPDAAAELLADAVVNQKELGKAATLLEGGKAPSAQKAAKALHARGMSLKASDEILKKLNAY